MLKHNNNNVRKHNLCSSQQRKYINLGINTIAQLRCRDNKLNAKLNYLHNKIIKLLFGNKQQ